MTSYSSLVTEYFDSSYWLIDDESVYEVVKSKFKCIEKLLSKVEEAFLLKINYYQISVKNVS